MKRSIRLFLFTILFACSVCTVVAAEPASQPSVRYEVVATTSGKGILHIYNNDDHPCTFVIYSITGQVVRTIIVKSGSEKVELAKGFYIVKSDYGSTKIVVR